jgi:predicted tellurium resistance membrane protein TerC
MNFKDFTRTETLGFIFLLLVYTLGIYFSNTDIEYFNTSYAQEDGFAEYGTAFILGCISLFLTTRLFKLWSVKPALWKIGVIGMALIFLFGAGEEISWGQRIFNVESSEYFKQNNAQQETNLHNMVVGETKINKLIFSKILTIVLVIYLLILPFLYRSITSIKKLVDSFGVPIPQWKHTIAFLLATALIFLIPSEEKWELYELAFAVIFFLIFLNPFNSSVYKQK